MLETVCNRGSKMTLVIWIFVIALCFVIYSAFNYVEGL
jgi:hypothetical protein